MKEPKFRPYFRIKGKYADHRKRCLIEWQENRWSVKSKSLPKPEILLRILDGIEWKLRTRGKKTKFSLSIREAISE